MPYQPFDPNKPLPPTDAAPSDQAGGGGYVPFNPAGAAPKQATGGGQSQQTTGGDPSAGQPADWSINWRTGDVKLPQSVQDWNSVAAHQQTMGVVGLKAQVDAARQRLGPYAAGSADIAGYATSPAQILNLIPYAGPPLAGATQEGVTSLAEGDDWKTAANKAIKGGAAGSVGGVAGKVLTAPSVVGHYLDVGGAAGLAALLGHQFGGETGALGGYLSNKVLAPASEKIKDFVANSFLTPAVQRGIQNVVQGGASSINQQPGNEWSQWVPWQ